jgi:hypothetical protein
MLSRVNGIGYDENVESGSQREGRWPHIKFAVAAPLANECRKSDSRSRAASQSAACVFLFLPRAALADSLALGYYRPPLTGLQFAALPTD